MNPMLFGFRERERRENGGLELIPYARLTLTGRNGEPIRTVYVDEMEIGTVRLSRDDDGLWIADDMQGHCHGVTYTSDWNAAKQLALGLGMRPR